MAGVSESSKAIGRAARDVLLPLGLTQKGRSRTWLDDHDWWTVVVEFQPSGFAKGSYLNVGACWLWWPSFRYHVSFDVGHRVERFEGFRSEAQFDLVAAHLADRAAEEVLSMRGRFSSLGSAIGYLEHELERARVNAWDVWHAAMGFALAGRSDEARRVASQSAPPSWMPGWEMKLREELAQFSALDDSEMKDVVRASIDAARSILQLPRWPGEP